jgi:hypothetical protein
LEDVATDLGRLVPWIRVDSVGSVVKCDSDAGRKGHDSERKKTASSYIS